MPIAPTVDLATAAEDALDAARPAIADLRLRVEAALDPAPATGDRQLLERMIGNLVDNAVRHNNDGRWIWLRTGTRNGSAFLEIANSGPHIPAAEVPSLFEAFRRLDGRSASRDGVGLGLSIARSVIAAHGAAVLARSQPGGGLDISVRMPPDEPGQQRP